LPKGFEWWLEQKEIPYAQWQYGFGTYTPYTGYKEYKKTGWYFEYGPIEEDRMTIIIGYRGKPVARLAYPKPPQKGKR